MSIDRKSGKALYDEAFGVKSKFTEGIRISRGQQAIIAFAAEAKVATAQNDKGGWALAIEGQANTFLRLASMPGFVQRNSTKLVIYNFQQAIQCLISLEQDNESIKSVVSMHNIYSKFIECVTSAHAFVVEMGESRCSDFVWQSRCSLLESLLGGASARTGSLAVALVNDACASEIFKQIVRYDVESDYRQVISCLGEISRPLAVCDEVIERMKASRSERVRAEADRCEVSRREYDNSLALYAARSDSKQHFAVAESMLSGAIFEAEEINMDSVYIAIDEYRAAMIYARNQCLESEAIAVGGLAKVFHKVLKMEKRGHELDMQAVLLADGATHADGRTFFHTDWYKDVKARIEEYQQQQAAFDAVEVEKQRAPTLAKLKPVLDAIAVAIEKPASKGAKAVALVNHIFEKHPPTKKDVKKIDLTDKISDDEAMKRGLLTVVTYYHPDKNKNHGIEWFVLCEEICKSLNEYYSFFKGQC